MKKAFTISLLLLIVSLITAYFLYIKESKNTDRVALLPQKNSKLGSVKADVVTVEQPELLEKTENTQQKEKGGEMLSPALELEVKNWLSSRGYVEMTMVDGKFQEVPSDYNSYNEDTLKSLADSGDRIAQMYYSEKQMSKGDFLKAEEYAYLAVENGFTKPIKDLVAVNIAKAMQELKQGNDEFAKKAYIDAMAWKEVVNVRKDPWLNLEGYNVYSNKFEIAESDKQLIKERSIELYNQLKEGRLKKGLGEFDNSIPDLDY